jgi:hypothetical protein
MTINRTSGAGAALVFVLAGLLGLGAALDPSGIFTLVGWTGGRAVAALWWWAPYIVYAPLLLLLAYWGATAVLSGADPGRVGLLTLRLWAVTVLSASAAEFLYSVVVIAPTVYDGKCLIPLNETGAFLLWSSGYAALKMALLGWPAALAGTFVYRAGSRRDTAAAAVSSSTLPFFTAGGTMFTVALLGPWLDAHWWGGSPVGFIYATPLPLAPAPSSGLWRSLLAFGLMGIIIWRHTAVCLRAMGRSPDLPSIFWLGATAGVSSGAGLFAAQLAELAVHEMRRHNAQDFWFIPAALLRGVDVLSFSLTVGFAAGCIAALGSRWAAVANRERGTVLGRAGWAMSAAALAMAVVGAVRFDPPPAYSATAEPRQPAVGGGMSPLSVGRGVDGPRIVDSSGSMVRLRGVNVNQLGEYYQQDPTLASALPLTEQDFADIAALGMNVVRLTLSWSQLEPQRGQISADYLHRIRQAVDWAGAHGVYVLLDMHQDAWSAHVAAEPHRQCRAGTAPMIGWDGAPAWATYTDGTPPCQVTGRDLAPNVSRAFQSFYLDRDDIQSSLIAGWRALAGEFAGDATVAGYDLLNEPNFGDTPPISSTVLLFNYYARSIQAIRQAEGSRAGGFHHPVFVEPSIIWSGFGIDNLPPRAFTTDRQIVFSPHLYNESITADQDFGFNLISIERGFRLAAQLGTPLWIGEWGYFKDPREQAALLERQVRAEDALQLGSAFWVWKQACGDPHVYPGKVAGDLRLTACPSNSELGTSADIARQLARPYVRRSPGRILGIDVSDGITVITGESGPAGTDRARACDLEIWLPGDTEPKVRSAEGAEVSRIVRVEPGQAALGQSGGWLVGGCLKPGRFRVALD